MKPAVDVFPTAEAVMQAAAEHFVSSAVAATCASGRFAVTLAGGSTPKALYTLLARNADAAGVDWSRVDVFWGDERCVPPADSRSNYRMACESLLDHVPVPHENIHRICGEDDPTAAAAAYEHELRTVFVTPDGPPRLAPGARFDLILLGMGANGHTASLFPGMAAVRETERWVMAEYVEAVAMWRVTLTPLVINAAAEVVFVVSGHEKAAMLHQVLEGPRRPDALPAQVIAPRQGRVRWLVDAAAAGHLERR